MKLILIYGPPASGKLSIAEKVAKKTRFKVFHNHLVIDLLANMLNTNSKSFWEFSKKARLNIIKEAVKENDRGIIITLSYTGNEDDFIKRILKTVKNYYLVKLNCGLKDLKTRVSKKSRAKYGKIKNKEELIKWLDRYDDKLVYPNKKSLVLNTSKLSIKQCANRILKYCK